MCDIDRTSESELMQKHPMDEVLAKGARINIAKAKMFDVVASALDGALNCKCGNCISIARHTLVKANELIRGELP